MRIWIGLILCVAALGAAEKPKQQASRAKPAAAAMTLPPGAVEAEPGTWRHTDRQGRKWVYRNTPFGLTRFEDKQGAAAPAPPAAARGEAVTKAFDDGEFVRFERPGPFGVYKWRRNKSELNEAERRAWERTQASGGAAARD